MPAPKQLTKEQLNNLLTRLKDELEYSEENEIGGGVFKARVDKPKRPKGSWAGKTNPHTGYRQISIGCVSWYEHRLAYLHHTGEMPDFVDHINGNRSDNRIGNLRACSITENNAAKQRGKLRGVAFILRRPPLKRPWRAQIQSQRKIIRLGYFATKEEAYAAYNQAATAIFGEFARLNEGFN